MTLETNSMIEYLQDRTSMASPNLSQATSIDSSFQIRPITTSNWAKVDTLYMFIFDIMYDYTKQYKWFSSGELGTNSS